MDLKVVRCLSTVVFLSADSITKILRPSTHETKGLVGGNYDAIKLLAKGELTKKLTIKVDAASKSAVEKVAKAGGTLELPEAK